MQGDLLLPQYTDMMNSAKTEKKDKRARRHKKEAIKGRRV
jgi:hypothetical protein